jgi:hypothetical protein
MDNTQNIENTNPEINTAVSNADLTFYKVSGNFKTKTEILASGKSVTNAASYSVNQYVIVDDVVDTPAGPSDHIIVSSSVSIIYHDQWFEYVKGTYGSIGSFSSTVSGANVQTASFYWLNAPANSSPPDELIITINGDFRAYNGQFGNVLVAPTPQTSFTIPSSAITVNSSSLTVNFSGNMSVTSYQQMMTYQQISFDIHATY